jgi:hypothetical protein
MTIGYYHIIPRYAKLTNPGKKEIKKNLFSRENYRSNFSELIIPR